MFKKSSIVPDMTMPLSCEQLYAGIGARYVWSGMIDATLYVENWEFSSDRCDDPDLVDCLAEDFADGTTTAQQQSVLEVRYATRSLPP